MRFTQFVFLASAIYFGGVAKADDVEIPPVEIPPAAASINSMSNVAEGSFDSIYLGKFSVERPSSLETIVMRLDPEKVMADDGDGFIYPLVGDYANCPSIRLYCIDTPEIAHFEHGIFIDQIGKDGINYGRKAAEYTKNVLDNANEIYIILLGRGRYERALGILVVDGRILQSQIYEQNLGYWMGFSRRDNIIIHSEKSGDIDVYKTMKNAWDTSKSKTRALFENPRAWRKKNQEVKLERSD